jgi:hypothetical protein
MTAQDLQSAPAAAGQAERAKLGRELSRLDTIFFLISAMVDASFTQSPTLQPTAVQVTTRSVTVEITKTTPSQDRDYTAISELAFEGATA